MALSLTISNNRDSYIRIGDDIVIRVSKADRNRATLSIEAPTEVEILRSKLIDKAEAR